MRGREGSERASEGGSGGEEGYNHLNGAVAANCTALQAI